MSQKSGSIARGGLSFAVFILLPLFLAACSGMQNDSLFTDAQSSLCPPGCANDLKADDNQISLKVSSNAAVVPLTKTRLDIGGECYASLFPNNSITVSVDGVASVSYYSVGSKGQTPKCVNGRYDIEIDLSTLMAAGNYNVIVELIAYDANGTIHRNASEGSTYLSLIRN